MPKVTRPYSRVYWEAKDDPKFEHVWHDNAALATWLRLLVAADMAWPASADLYHGVNRTALKRLTDAGLVDVRGGTYRIRGLDKERQARSEAATAAVRTRYDRSTPVVRDGYARIPQPDTDGLPSRDETSKDKPSRANAPAADAYDVMIGLETTTHRQFTYRQGHQIHDTLTGDVAAHGAEKMAAEYRSFVEEHPGSDIAQVVFGVHNALHPLIRAVPPTKADRAADLAEARERAEQRGRERRAQRENPDAA